MVKRRTRAAVTVNVQSAKKKSNPKGGGRQQRKNRSRNRRSNLNRRMPRFNMDGVTTAGRNFLKCAFASPDFSVDPGQGIPDGYEGKALMRKDVFTDVKTFTPEKETFILVMPTPGQSYWVAECGLNNFPDQATVWKPQLNSSFGTLFGSPTDQSSKVPTNPVERDNQVSKFRYASSTFEITPTSNYMTFSGAITVWKINVSMAQAVRAITPTSGTQSSLVELALTGVNGVSKISPDNKPFKFIDGAYTMAVNTEPTWNFKPVLSGVTRIPSVGEDKNTNPTFGQFEGDIVGMGDLQTLVIRVSTPKGAVNTAILKAWSCIEYQPSPASAMYQFSTTSPTRDEVALKLYREIALKVPVAVCVAENDGFWTDRVLPVIKSFMSAARAVGGVIPPIGAAMAGVDMITSAFGWL